MGEAAMAEAAVESSTCTNNPQLFGPAREVLDSFQFALGSVWNHFKRGLFFLHRSTTFNIDSAASPRGLPVFHDCLFLQRP